MADYGKIQKNGTDVYLDSNFMEHAGQNMYTFLNGMPKQSTTPKIIVDKSFSANRSVVTLYSGSLSSSTLYKIYVAIRSYSGSGYPKVLMEFGDAEMTHFRVEGNAGSYYYRTGTSSNPVQVAEFRVEGSSASGVADITYHNMNTYPATIAIVGGSKNNVAAYDTENVMYAALQSAAGYSSLSKITFDPGDCDITGYVTIVEY